MIGTNEALSQSPSPLIFGDIAAATGSRPLGEKYEIMDLFSGTVRRSNNASLVMTNDRVLYFAMITKYIEEKSKKGKMHRAFKMGTRELRFEIMCRDKGRRWMNRERITHECTLRSASCVCTCNKPLLLHMLCFYVMAVCSTVA